MLMDSRFTEFSNSINGFKFEDDSAMPGSRYTGNFGNEFRFKDEPLEINFGNFLSTSPELNAIGSSPSTGSDTVDSLEDQDSGPVLKYLNQILLEENIEEKPSMFHDPLALKAAEKSFYEVIGQKYPSSPCHQPQFSLMQNVDSRSSDIALEDPQWVVDPGEHRLFMKRNSWNPSNLHSSFDSISNFSGGIHGLAEPSLGTLRVPNTVYDNESILQFRRGMEEANKLLPRNNQLIIDLGKYDLPSDGKEVASDVVKVEKDDGDDTSNSSRVRKHYHSEEGDLDAARSRKQSAVFVDEAEISELFDRVLLFKDVKRGLLNCQNSPPKNDLNKALQENAEQHGTKGGKNRVKKAGNQKEVVDLSTLLISCAQSIASNDTRTAYEQLKQIRKHSTPLGDGSQRLAHIFANSLEARLAGTGTQLYASFTSKRISAVQKLKAYHLYLQACPFKTISIFFANAMIYNTALEAKVLHIVDFGISYGFQWPILIHFLSKRPGGPPKLRITGIELPQSGFRPAEMLEETGRRLKNYCERFDVPFEYHAIATEKWETVKIEDLNLKSGDVLAVNCFFRFENIPDETVVLDSPRDAILQLIKKMNPHIFVHAVANGSYSAPFFVTRFREALFFYSAMFDMFDTTIPRDDKERLHFEQEFYGREIMNIVACEGIARVVRPETYRQWQLRNIRAGFRPLALDQELIKKLRSKATTGYHKDFVFDEYGNWMLQGWKGRVLGACSCWVPA